MLPLLLDNNCLGSAGHAHPGIDLILDAVVIRRTKKQLAHTIAHLVANARIGETIGKFPKKWLYICDEAD